METLTFQETAARYLINRITEMTSHRMARSLRCFSILPCCATVAAVTGLPQAVQNFCSSSTLAPHRPQYIRSSSDRQIRRNEKSVLAATPAAHPIISCHSSQRDVV